MLETFIESSGSSRTLSAKVSADSEFGHKDASGSMCVTSVESSGDGDVIQLAGDSPLVSSSAEGTADRCAVIGGVDPLAGSSAEGAADQCKTGVGDVVTLAVRLYY